MSFKRRTVTTIETHEVLVVRRRAGEPSLLCAACADEAEMLSPRDAARLSGVSQRTIYRWMEDGRIHFSETADGGLYVCLAPLNIDVG